MAVPPNDFIIQEELERRILHGLACEWESARWILSSSNREKLRKPLFSLPCPAAAAVLLLCWCCSAGVSAALLSLLSLLGSDRDNNLKLKIN